MKSTFLFLLIFGQSALCMQALDDKPLNQQHEHSNDEIVLPSHILPNAEVNLFIDALKQGEVLLSVATESDLKASQVFKDFFFVCYQADRYQDAFYFVPENMKDEATKALSLYSKTNPSFYAYLVPVKDNAKFWELACKTSAGCAGKGGKWFDSVNWDVTLNSLISEGYRMLDKGKIEYAMAAPRQDSNSNSSWSCGPNSGYRAMRLLDEVSYDYDSFVECCPRRISKSQTIETGFDLSILGWIFPPLQLVGTVTAIVGASISSDVGPTPAMLAEFLTRHMQKNKACFSGYSPSSDPSYNPIGGYERSITFDIRNGLPRIVLIVSATFTMHYVTIIGYKPSPYSEHVFEEAVILDTDGTIATITSSNLAHWLNRDGIANGLLDAKYNTVEFSRK